MADNNDEVDYEEGDYDDNNEDDDNNDDLIQDALQMEDDLTKESSKISSKLSEISGNLDELSIYVGQVDYSATAEELRGKLIIIKKIKYILLYI